MWRMATRLDTAGMENINYFIPRNRKMRKYFTVLILVAPNDDSFDNYIKAVLDMLRAAMPTGIPELGLPVLDPFAVPHFDIPHIE